MFSSLTKVHWLTERLRGLPLMTSALRGRGLALKPTIVQIGYVSVNSDEGGGGQKVPKSLRL